MHIEYKFLMASNTEAMDQYGCSYIVNNVTGVNTSEYSCIYEYNFNVSPLVFIISSLLSIIFTFGTPLWIYIWSEVSCCKKKKPKEEVENPSIQNAWYCDHTLVFYVSKGLLYPWKEMEQSEMESRKLGYSSCNTRQEFEGYKRKEPISSEIDTENYEWVILGAAFMLQAIVQGIAFSVGVFYSKWLDDFQDTKAMTAWIGSLNIGILYCASPFASIFCKVISHRFVICLGAVLTCVGLFASAFAPNIVILYITYGVIAGIGMSCMYTPPLAVVAVYFKKRQRLILALCVIGGGFGSLLGPLVLNFWNDLYGWRGSMIMTAATALLGCVYGLMLRPYNFWAHGTRGHDKPNNQKSLSEVFDFTLLLDTGLRIVLFSTFVKAFGGFIMKMYIIEYAKTFGLDPAMGAWLISANGISKIIGIGVVGLISLLISFNAVKVYILGTVFSGLVVIMYALYQSFETFLTYSILHGITIGVIAGIHPSVNIELFGISSITHSIGYKRLGTGIGALIGPPFAGWFCDVTKAYAGSFILGGTCIIISGIIVSAVPSQRHLWLDWFKRCNKPSDHEEAMHRAGKCIQGRVLTHIQCGGGRHPIIEKRIKDEDLIKLPPIIRANHPIESTYA